MRDLAVSFETDAGQPEISINCPSSLLANGLQQVVNSAEIGSVLSNQTVYTIFNGVVSGDPKKVGVALVGVGMTAVGVSVPVVGWIGAAITIVATAVSAAFNRAKARRPRMMQSAPASSTPSSLRCRSLTPTWTQPPSIAASDPYIRTHNWTNIWAPAFKGEWQGVNRQGGMAFAQGGADSGDDDLTHEATRFFVPSGGLGVIPGTDQVTRVVQVSLETNPDDIDAAAWLAFKKGGLKGPARHRYQRAQGLHARQGHRHVLPGDGPPRREPLGDVDLEGGVQLPRQPLRVPRRRAPAARCLEEWAESGLRYIREVCYPWYPKYSQPDGTISAALNLDGPDPAADLAGYFGTGIFLAMGVWAGRVAPGSTSYVQKYSIYPRPAGFSGAELHTIHDAYGMEKSSVSSLYSGAFLPIYDPAKWPDQCMGERYHRGPLGVSIADTLADLQKLQAWTLRHTLASAYCSQSDAAFAGNANAASRENLLKMRAALLKASDRMYINLNDVPDDERGISGMPRSESWKQQLVAAGVPATPKKVDNSVKLSAGQRPPGQGVGKGIPCEAGIPCPDKEAAAEAALCRGKPGSMGTQTAQACRPTRCREHQHPYAGHRGRHSEQCRHCACCGPGGAQSSAT
jgi:hypothetical protein